LIELQKEIPNLSFLIASGVELSLSEIFQLC